MSWVGPQQAFDIFDTTCFIAGLLTSIAAFGAMKMRGVDGWDG
jgi:hypothetical protein